MESTERRFVNPYTFVPFPAGEVVREPAPGHAPTAVEAAARYTGSFEVSWLTRTPLVLPEGLGWYEGGSVRIPGSSTKGAVRSVHEALFAGCPRVVTTDFVPVYRQTVSGDMTAEWQLAMVAELGDDGDPRAVRLCDAPVWVNAVALKKKYGGGLPRTGDVVKFDEEPTKHRGLNRDELPARDKTDLIGRNFTVTARADVRPAGKGWTRGSVLLVTDVAARTLVKKQHDRNHDPIDSGVPGEKLRETAACFWATGELRNELAYFPPRTADHGTSDTLATFGHLVDGAADTQDYRNEVRRGAPPGDFAEVVWWKFDAFRALRLPGQPHAKAADPALLKVGSRYEPDPAHLEPVALRRRADGRLLVGDVVWVQTTPDGAPKIVTAVKLAAAWRETPPGARDLGGRLWAKPCRTAEELCLSCAVFGAADESGVVAGSGQQTSYGGHVRFGSVVGAGLRVGEPVTLAPLSSPRPGAGMFYLEHQPVLPGRKVGDLPGHWGSSADGRHRRRLRGRKFYWHSDPDDQVNAISQAGLKDPMPRHLRAGGDGFASTVRLVEKGQRLSQKVTFDGLDRLSLLTLLAAFDPTGVLPAEPGDYGIHLAGGKPLGLGSVTATVDPTSIRVTTTAGRYLGGDPLPFDPVWSETDRAALSGRVGAVDVIHEAAAQVLALHGLGDYEQLVTYPITVPWGRYNSDEFVRSFAFFGENNGEKLAGQGRPTRRYAPLPELRPVADQSPTPQADYPHA